MRRVAVIDIGTVTARLAVADVEGTRVVRLAKSSNICNLGEGVAETGRLARTAMERVLSCVGAYVESAREAGAEAAACTLTSAARDASNSPDLGQALSSLGLEPLVIPGEVEGALTFLGVAQDFPDQRILVADNGGGSTELACGTLGENVLDLRFVRSVNVGCRRLTELFLSRTDPPSAADVAEAHAFARGLFSPAIEEGGLRSGGTSAPSTLVVTGGTATSLVAVRDELEPYDARRVHLARLSKGDVTGLEARLASLTTDGRAKLPGLQEKRAPVILGGAVALSELMAQTDFSEMTVSESDLLFGLSIVSALTLEGRPSPVVWKPELRPMR